MCQDFKQRFNEMLNRDVKREGKAKRKVTVTQVTRSVAIAAVLVGFAFQSVFAEVIFHDNFDSHPDWQSQQQPYGGSGIAWGTPTFAGTCSKYCPPVGWTSYRVAQSYWAPNPRDTYLINSDGARGGSGKGITYNVESTGDWGLWAGGGIDKYLGAAGYPELYVRFWVKESSEFCYGSAALNANAMAKLVRITALRRDPTIDPKIFNPEEYPSPDTSPTFIAAGYRRFQPNYGIPAQFDGQERYAPNYEGGPMTTFPATLPSDITTGGAGYCGDNKWHSYEFYVKLNSALGAADGVYRAWLDGNLVAEKSNVPWVKPGTDKNGTVMSLDTGWNWVMIADNVDSTAYPLSAKAEMARYIDDVVMSTHYSGPPPNPVTVTAAGLTSTSMRVKWAPGTNGADYLLDGYRIHYGTDPASLNDSMTVGNVTQADIPNLVEGQTYYFSVTAFNKGTADTIENESSQSAVAVSSTTQAPADSEPPVISISSPAAGATVSGTVTVKAAASDNVGVTKVEIYLNGAIFGVVGTSPFNVPWNTTSYSDGPYTLTAKAYDAAGNVTTTSSVSVSVNNQTATANDTTAPSVSISSPSQSSTVSGSAAIQTSVSDNIGVSKVYFYINGNLLGTVNAAPFTYYWNTLSVANGLNNLTAKAYDAAGNNATSQAVTVNVNNSASTGDTTAPSVSITSPAYGSSVSGSAAIQTSVSDNVGVRWVEFYVNGKITGTVSAAPFTYNWNTLAVANGLYSITAKAYDAAGNNTLSKGVTLEVYNSASTSDPTPPTVSITSPSYGSSVSGTAAVQVSASDNVGITKVEFYVSGKLSATETAAPFTFNWNTSALANGPYSVMAKAYDAAGNMKQSSAVTLFVAHDTTAPTVTVTSPASGIQVSGTVAVAASASDNVAVSKVEFYLNGTLVSTSTSAPYSYIWNTMATANGAYTLTAKAFDADGNIGQSNVNISVINDVVAPTVNSFAMPAITNSITVPVTSFTATDNVGVTGYLITESPSIPAASAAGWSSSAPASFTFAGNGTRTAYAWAKDAVGNVSASSASTVVIDTALPVIKSVSFSNGSPKVTIKASATDNIAIAKLLLYVDGAVKLESAESSLSYVWDVPAPGNHIIMVKAYDTAGNVRSQSMSITR